MHAITSRHEDVYALTAKPTVGIIAIQCGSVRLDISTPENGSLASPAARNPDVKAYEAPTYRSIQQLLEKRLAIASLGLDEMRQALNSGRLEDARVLLDKLDEDFHMLRRRVSREFDRVEMISVV